MGYVFIILVLLMLVRCAVPIKGFFLDAEGHTESVTGKGMQSQIVLHETKSLVKRVSAPEVSNESNKEEFHNDGVEIGDLTNNKKKISNTVNVDMMYSNIDSSDESLTDTVKKALNNKQ